jgi:hypothetical protein
MEKQELNDMLGRPIKEGDVIVIAGSGQGYDQRVCLIDLIKYNKEGRPTTIQLKRFSTKWGNNAKSINFEEFKYWKDNTRAKTITQYAVIINDILPDNISDLVNLHRIK